MCDGTSLTEQNICKFEHLEENKSIFVAFTGCLMPAHIRQRHKTHWLTLLKISKITITFNMMHSVLTVIFHSLVQQTQNELTELQTTLTHTTVYGSNMFTSFPALH